MTKSILPGLDYRQSDWRNRRGELLLAVLAGVLASFLGQIISFFSRRPPTPLRLRPGTRSTTWTTFPSPALTGAWSPSPHCGSAAEKSVGHGVLDRLARSLGRF